MLSYLKERQARDLGSLPTVTPRRVLLGCSVPQTLGLPWRKLSGRDAVAGSWDSASSMKWDGPRDIRGHRTRSVVFALEGLQCLIQPVPDHIFPASYFHACFLVSHL